MKDVFVHEMDLPTTIEGFTRLNEDGSYTIVLNARSAHSRRIRTYDHEVRHIVRNDFDRDDVQEVEVENHAQD